MSSHDPKLILDFGNVIPIVFRQKIDASCISVPNWLPVPVYSLWSPKIHLVSEALAFFILKICRSCCRKAVACQALHGAVPYFCSIVQYSQRKGHHLGDGKNSLQDVVFVIQDSDGKVKGMN